MVAFPQRQEFIWLNFDERPRADERRKGMRELTQSGHEQQGRRPGLVVSHTSFNQKMGFAVIVPVSSTSRVNPFYLPIPAGLSVKGVIMCDQPKSLDFRARKFSSICTCPDLLFQDVLRRIKPIIF